MKRIVILLSAVFTLISGVTSAQDTTKTRNQTPVERKGYIGLMLGPSFPVGDFGDDDFYSNNQAGAAKTGMSIFIVDFGYNFHPNVGIAASWMGGANPMDDGKIQELFEETYGGTWGVDAGSYGWGGLFVGPLFSIPLQKATIDFKMTAGFASGIFPEILITGYNGSDYVHLKQESATGSSFGFSIGGGVRIPISPKFNIMTRLEYVGMKTEAEVVTKEGDLFGGYTEVDRSDVEQSMNTINLLFGFAYRLK